jgi:two-component system, NarL family, invasion response regulator UvrY
MIDILVADDHPVVRWGLRQMFENYPDLRIAGEATTSDAVVEQVKHGTWDLVILDLALPPGGGMEALKAIRTLAPDLPILVLSIYPEEELAVRMLRLGANGYVTKGAEAEILVPAIRKVAQGGKYVSPAVSELLLASVGPKGAADPKESFTAREHQVLRLLGRGRTITEIAQELRLSVKTVSTYRTRLLEKLGMRTTGELIRYAVSEKMVE